MKYNKMCFFQYYDICKVKSCRYYHNRSWITCVYWMAGRCLKGDDCSFLHGYYLQLVLPCLMTYYYISMYPGYYNSQKLLQRFGHATRNENNRTIRNERKRFPNLGQKKQLVSFVFYNDMC